LKIITNLNEILLKIQTDSPRILRKKDIENEYYKGKRRQKRNERRA
jgi:hypothetical protein